MDSEQGGKPLANQGKRVTADYGQRAAQALDQLVPGPNRDKNIARLLNVSDRMVRYLRQGQFWTIDRLNQASVALGTAFDAALYQPASDARRSTELYDIAERLARLENWRAEMASGNDSGLPPAPGGEAVGQSRENVPSIGVGASGRAAARDGQATPDEGAPVAQTLHRVREEHDA